MKKLLLLTILAVLLSVPQSIFCYDDVESGMYDWYEQQRIEDRQWEIERRQRDIEQRQRDIEWKQQQMEWDQRGLDRN